MLMGMWNHVVVNENSLAILQIFKYRVAIQHLKALHPQRTGNKNFKVNVHSTSVQDS